MSTDNVTRPVDPARVDTNLDAARADVKAEIARTDNKVSLMLAFVGALLAGVWTVGTSRHLPAATVALGLAGTSTLLVVAGLLLWAVRPNLGGTRPVGFPLWANLTAEEIRTHLHGDDRAEHVAALSRIAVAKYTHLRRAVDLTAVAGALLVIAAVVMIGGAA